MTTWRHAWLLASLLSAGCADATQLLVTVTTAPDLPPIAVAVAQVEDADDTVVDGPRRFVVERGGSSFAVVPRGADASRLVRVVVTGCSTVPAEGDECVGDDIVATQSFRTSFLPGQAVAIAMELSRACSEVGCAVGEICRAASGRAACAAIGTADGGMVGAPDGSIRDAGRSDARVDASMVDGGPPGPAPVDVMILLEQTGSNAPSVIADLPTLSTRCIAPLLALTDVQVGVSYSGEFPITPYGAAGDRPFEGGIEPTTSSAAIATEIAGRPVFMGSDGPDATVEAISVLTGGALAASSLPIACSAGRIAGGCWRSGARRVIVAHTDSLIHGGPNPTTTGLYSPYVSITPAPADWLGVRASMISSGTVLIFLDSGATVPAPEQFDEMLTDLGQPLTDHHWAPSSELIGTACDAIVARVRVLAGR